MKSLLHQTASHGTGLEHCKALLACLTTQADTEVASHDAQDHQE
jgi:hypothetical protein